jgi:hypothetical protein
VRGGQQQQIVGIVPLLGPTSPGAPALASTRQALRRLLWCVQSRRRASKTKLEVSSALCLLRSDTALHMERRHAARRMAHLALSCLALRAAPWLDMLPAREQRISHAQSVAKALAARRRWRVAGPGRAGARLLLARHWSIIPQRTAAAGLAQSTGTVRNLCKICPAQCFAVPSSPAASHRATDYAACKRPCRCLFARQLINQSIAAADGDVLSCCARRQLPRPHGKAARASRSTAERALKHMEHRGRTGPALAATHVWVVHRALEKTRHTVPPCSMAASACVLRPTVLRAPDALCLPGPSNLPAPHTAPRDFPAVPVCSCTTDIIAIIPLHTSCQSVRLE